MLSGVQIAAAAVVLLTASCSTAEIEVKHIHPRAMEQEGQLKEYPCPEAADIAPCTCTVLPDFNMDMDCSDVTSSTQLAQIFTGDLPFLDYNRLTINFNSYLTEIRAGDLGQATFKEIYINNGVLSVINPEAFGYSHSTLTTLDLDSNNIYSFPFYEMYLFTELNYLSMQYNSISGFQLQSSSNLRYFNIDDNPLLEITASTLTDLPSLREASFIHAAVQMVYPATFVGFPTLNLIHLENNQLAELKMGTIELSVSATIHLYYNSISNVEVGAITGVGGSIDISHNLLTELHEAVWKPLFDSGFFIDAADNPLNCGCLIAWLVQNSKYMNDLSTDTTCESGDKVHDINPSIFDTLC